MVLKCFTGLVGLLLLIVLGSPVANAQAFNTKKFTAADGLPSKQIHCVVQDRLGHLWLGTESGACQFDGQTFHSLGKDNPLTGNPVHAIYEDSKGDIWFGVQRKGVVRFNGTVFQVFTTKDGLLNDNVSAICEDGSGRVWLGTDEGVSIYDGRSFQSLTSGSGLVQGKIFSFHRDSRNRMWVAALGGVSLVDGKKISALSSSDGLLNNIVYDIVEDSSKRMWFATYTGVCVWDGKEFRSFTQTDGMPVERVLSLQVDRNGQVWAGTVGGGIVKFDSAITDVFRPADDIDGNTVKSICLDREGNIWLGTMNGLFMYNGDRFSIYTTEAGLAGDNILSLYADSGGGVWVGSLSSGLDLVRNDSVLNLSVPSGLKGSAVWSITPDGSGKLWLGTSGGPVLFNPSSYQSTRPFPALNGVIVFAILPRADGSISFGTDRGIFTWKEGLITRVSTSDGLGDERIRVLYEDAYGNLWIGTFKGLFSLQDGKVKSYTRTHGMPIVPVTSIQPDGQGQLLVGFYEFGLVRFDPFSKKADLQVLNKEKGLSSNKILFTLIDRRKRLWLGMDNGLDMVDFPTFLKNGVIRNMHYEKSNGFPGSECNVATEDNSGRIWLGAVNGLVRYNPAAGDIPSSIPLVHIERIQLFLEDVDWSKLGQRLDERSGLPVSLHLSNKSKHITFLCNAIYLTAPGEVRYRYFLEGFEENWSPPTPLGQVSYSNVPPGDYLFKVQASANGREWSTPVTYAFTIDTPWWMTKIAYVSYVLLSAGIVLGIYKLRTRTLRISQEVLKREVEARTRELSAKNLELAKLSLVASETDNAVMIFDARYELEWVNTGFTKMTGFDLGQVKKERGNNLQALTSNKEVLLHLDECIQQHKSYIYESEIRNRSGEVLWASSTLTPIIDENGQLKNIVVIDTDITLRKRMEQQIRAALEEKGVLLREIHHRVKNNLQIIISLFNLQTSYVSDEKAYKALREGQDRIKSMALIHERFYQADGLSQIDFDEYIKRLAENLMQSFRIEPGRIRLEIHSDKISLDIDTAVPTGLIINEIVTNALKHAFVGKSSGELRIDMTQTAEDQFRLSIADNGVGFPDGVKPEELDSLGVQLIQALTQQLDGEMKIETAPGKGVKYIITFKRIS